MEKHFGKCALCGKECELTFEHIPPRKAFNWIPQKSFSGDTILKSFSSKARKPWDLSSLPYINSQRGLGYFSLCKSCNNTTGKWYGNEYIKFAYGFYSLMNRNNAKPGMTMFVEEATFKPLLVIKQIISMFCTVNSNDKDDHLMQKLRQFVLDKDSNIFPKDHYKLGMYLFSNGIERRAPFTLLGIINDGHPKLHEVSEIVAYPLGFLLYRDYDADLKMPCPDITGFCDFSCSDECTISIKLPVYECNTFLPGDFRTKDEINQCIANNIKWEEDQ